MSEEQKKQVRLLKLFMMANGVYGAEIETQGFSGYLAEVLILKHGTFLGVMRSFADFVRSGNERLFSVPDPVDESRDLGVAVSGEKLGRMVLAARAFLARPDVGYFKAVARRPRSLMRDQVVVVVFKHKSLSEDILWGELRRSIRHLVRHVEERGFRVARSLCASNNADSSAFLFIPEFPVLPKLEQRVGPSVALRDESERFVRHNRRRARLVWVDEQARIRLLQDRTYTGFVELLSYLVSARVESIGASAEVARGLRRSSRIVGGTQLSGRRTEQWLADGVNEIVSDTAGISAP